MQDMEQLRRSYGEKVVAAALPAPPPLHTELIALPRALILSKDKKLTSWALPDSGDPRAFYKKEIK